MDATIGGLTWTGFVICVGFIAGVLTNNATVFVCITFGGMGLMFLIGFLAWLHNNVV